ncbi:unnamed protein product, partial [Amoebophrya sp. A25]
SLQDINLRTILQSGRVKSEAAEENTDSSRRDEQGISFSVYKKITAAKKLLRDRCKTLD